MWLRRPRHAADSRAPLRADRDAFDALVAAPGASARAYERGAVAGVVRHGPVALRDVKLKDGSHLMRGKNVAPFTAEGEGACATDVPFDL